MAGHKTPKEKLLENIRTSLLEKCPNPYPELEEKPLYQNTNIPLDVLFAEQLTAASGKFIYCETELQLIENLVLLADDRRWRKIYCWEPPLQALLSSYEFPFFKTDTNLPQIEVGITSCELLIARSGSVLISSASEAGRRLSIYPPCHVVVAYTSQLIMDLKDAFSFLQKKYQALPSMISNITGPSRTADIEKTLVLGAHGPKELLVFLLEDQ